MAILLHEPAKADLQVAVRTENHSLGLPALDGILHGGLRPGSLCILQADPGDVQELVAMHFATAAGGVLFVAADRSPHDLERQWAAYERSAEEVLFACGSAGIPMEVDGHERIVVDSFSQLAASLGWDKAMDQLRSLRASVVQSGQAALVVVYPGFHSPQELAMLGILADALFEIDVEKTPTAQLATLRISKMRHVPGAARAFPASLHRDGLFLDVIKRVL